jgi:nicotinate-nucleotide adenylyltransferase
LNYGIYGGAFDPFHAGHLSVIRGALKSKKVDKIFIIPTGIPAIKSSRNLSLPPYRYYMASKAVKNIDHCEVSSVEFTLMKPSYTIDTVNSLLESGQIGESDRIYLVCGSDLIFDFDKWRQPERLLEKVSLLVAKRPGNDEFGITLAAEKILVKYGAVIEFFQTEAVDISSTEIRSSHNFSLLPSPVQEFIEKHDLYPEDRPLDSLSDESFMALSQYCMKLFFELSEKRLLHSLNTAVLSARYALRFGYDPNQAAIAGLLHDCAKELPLEDQRRLACEVTAGKLPGKEMIHAPAGVKCACEHYNVADSIVLDAINYHTTGRANMSGIEKIVYLADKLEPARDYDDLCEIRRLVELDLDSAMIECLSAIKESLTRKGMAFHNQSSDALEELKKRKKVTTHKEEKMNSKELSEKIAEILENKKAIDIEILPVAEKTIIADYFIVASGSSTTHIKALADEVSFVLKDELKISTDHIEGFSTGRWILMDYKDVIVHLFHPEERENYSLEKLWSARPADISIFVPESEDITTEPKSD